MASCQSGKVGVGDTVPARYRGAWPAHRGRMQLPHGHAHAFGLGEMTLEFSRLMIFGTSIIVSDPVNRAPANGLLPGKAALHWPEARRARDIPPAVCGVPPTVPATFDELEFGLGEKA